MRRISRLVAMAAAFALVLAACGTDEGGGDGVDPGTTVPDTGDDTATCEVDETDGNLNFYNWTEYIDPELVIAFETEYGVDVVEDFYDSNEAMLAKLQSGAVYDLIVPSDYMIAIMIEEGLLAEIQKDALSNYGNLDSAFVDPAFDPGGRYSVAYQWGTTGIGVNMDVVGEEFDPSWALLFDVDQIAGYPGGISLLNDPRETMGAALKYLGYSLNSTNESELQEAADLIASVKAHVASFDSDQYEESLVTGEVAVAHGYSGDFFAAYDDVDGWDTFTYVIPREGATRWIDNLAVPSDAEHPCTAHAFIDFLLDAENGAALTNWNFYASPNAAAEEYIDVEILEDETIYPVGEVEERLEIITDTGDFEINYTDYFAIARS